MDVFLNAYTRIPVPEDDCRCHRLFSASAVKAKVPANEETWLDRLATTSFPAATNLAEA